MLQRLPHGFLPNMKLEVVDKRNPRLIRVATIVDVDDQRIKVHILNYCVITMLASEALFSWHSRTIKLRLTSFLVKCLWVERFPAEVSVHWRQLTLRGIQYIPAWIWCLDSIRTFNSLSRTIKSLFSIILCQIKNK